jgi:hypothetical protein
MQRSKFDIPQSVFQIARPIDAFTPSSSQNKKKPPTPSKTSAAQRPSDRTPTQTGKSPVGSSRVAGSPSKPSTPGKSGHGSQSQLAICHFVLLDCPSLIDYQQYIDADKGAGEAAV